MSITEIYTKKSDTVKQLTEEAHKEYIDALEEACNEKGMNTSALALGAGAASAMMYRTKDPKTNVTLTTMQRFAAAAGKKVKITLEDLSDSDLER